jgi:A/G-specific adenine glycosylase
MQQTRIEQGLPYFLKITAAFPTIETLAAADEELLLRHWQGLGYYSRARNLHATAKNIVENHNGIIPNSFSELKKLKGIGAYSAAAIASIVFDEPIPVVDGNVMRVVARLFAIEEAVNGNEGKNKVNQCLAQIFDISQPGIFNEAIMEFGALQCVPSNPDCGKCPLSNHCAAFKMSKVNILPVKNPTKEVKTRHLNYLVLLINNHFTIMQQRKDNDIWKNLYEFPLIETESQVVEKKLCNFDFWKELPFINDKKEISFKQTFHYQQKLTHRLLKVTFTVASASRHYERSEVIRSLYGKWNLITLQEAETKPKPITIANFLKTITSNF